MGPGFDPSSPRAGVEVKRPPPGIAPPSGPAPPWVRTLAPADESDSGGEEEIYEEDFEDDEIEDQVEEARTDLASASDQVLEPPEEVEAKTTDDAEPVQDASETPPRALGESLPGLEASSSPKEPSEAAASGMAESPGESAFPQGLTKISAIKASVDLFATDSDEEEDGKQRFFSKLESMWQESHDSQPLDYSALNKMIQSVETSVDGGKPPSSEGPPAGEDEAGPTMVDHLSSRRSALQRSDSEPDGERPGTPGRPPSGRSRPRTPTAQMSPNSKALKHSAGSSLNSGQSANDALDSANVPQEFKPSTEAGPADTVSPEDAPANANSQQGRGKLEALKQKQATRRKQQHSMSQSSSLSESNPELTVSLSASDHGSPKQKDSGASRALSQQFRELEQQMLSLSSHGESRVHQRRSEAQVKALKKEAERLHVLLEEERIAKEAAVAGLEEAQKDFQRRHKQMREGYEARLRERQKELTACKLRLQELDQKGPKGKVLDEESTLVTLTDKELADLRQEIKEQEKLIAGYQQENESAVKQMKEMKVMEKKTVESLTQEIARLESQLADNSEREAVAAQEVGQKLKEKLSLETEITHLRQRAEERESELRAEIDRLRREKRDLDAKLGGVNLDQIAQEDALVKSIRSEMEILKQQHKMNVEEMRSKLEWYAENQQILTANDDLINQQADTILELERRLKMYEGEDGRGTATVKKVKELQKQLQQLQEALVSKNPSSLPALVHAARPSLEETEKVQEMQAAIKRLHHKLRAKDDEMERKLRALRQDHEKIRQQYETRKHAVAERESRGDVRRIKEAEKQLADVRSFYQKKVKALTEELQGFRKLDTSRENTSTTHVVPKRSVDQQEMVAKLSDQLRRKEQHIADLEAETVKLRTERGHADMRLESVVAEKQKVEELGVAALRKQVQDLLVERDQLLKQVEGSNSCPKGNLADASGEKLADAKVHAESVEMALVVVQRAHTEAVEKATRAEAAHQRALQQLHEDHAARVQEVRNQASREEAARWEARCYNAEKALAASERKVHSVQQELACVEAGLHLNPSAAQFRALEKKISMLEESEAVKEKRWQDMLEESQQVNAIQAAMERKKWEMLVQEKNMDIERFRMELDAILGTARELSLGRETPDSASESTLFGSKRPSPQPLRVLDPNLQSAPQG